MLYSAVLTLPPVFLLPDSTGQTHSANVGVLPRAYSAAEFLFRCMVGVSFIQRHHSEGESGGCLLYRCLGDALRQTNCAVAQREG